MIPKIKFLQALQPETVTFLAEIDAETLHQQMADFRRANEGFAMAVQLALGLRPNLDVVARKNLCFEISPKWQFTKLPGGNMHVRMKGQIISEGASCRLQATVIPNSFYNLLFWALLIIFFIELLFTATQPFRVATNLFFVALLIAIAAGSIVPFCIYKKRSLVRMVAKEFKLTVIRSEA